MKPATKKMIANVLVLMAPLFTLAMFLTPYVGLYKEKVTYNGVFYGQEYYSFYELLKMDIGVFSKIVMWVSLLGVLASTILQGITFLKKEQEEKYNTIALIVLTASTGLLLMTDLVSLFKTTSVAGAEIARWVDFMTIPYGLLIVYNITLLIYWIKKDNK